MCCRPSSLLFRCHSFYFYLEYSYFMDKRLANQFEFLQRIPFSHRLHRVLALLMPLAFETLDFLISDIILSVSSAEAKGCWPNHGNCTSAICLPQRDICMNLRQPTPKWRLASTANTQTAGLTYPSVLALVGSANKPSPRFVPDAFTKSARKIQQIYKPPHKLSPPVLQPLLSSKTSTAHAEVSWRYALIDLRLVPYKRVAVAMEACQQSGLPLVIVGTGPDFHTYLS